eukprot:TRINITY_DN42358_c0_g1_i1.p1 TRINITY_DN42358_c0_g1~~TRINITY_DN42358_c0_g1_i1.p1  ORF type:complete len:312 (+),score=59.03 TRINITY_DN42358_c0_g1_i1:58-993(+)
MIVEARETILILHVLAISALAIFLTKYVVFESRQHSLRDLAGNKFVITTLYTVVMILVTGYVRIESFLSEINSSSEIRRRTLQTVSTISFALTFSGHITLLLMRTRAVLQMSPRMQAMMAFLTRSFIVLAVLVILISLTLNLVNVDSAIFNGVSTAYGIISDIDGIILALIDAFSSVCFFQYVRDIDTQIGQSLHSLMVEARSRQTLFIAKRGLVISCVSCGGVSVFSVLVFLPGVLVQQWLYLVIYISLVIVGILWMDLKISLDVSTMKADEMIKRKQEERDKLDHPMQEYEPPEMEMNKSSDAAVENEQ